jgi:hypothetical protein
MGKISVFPPKTIIIRFYVKSVYKADIYTYKISSFSTLFSH